MRWVARMSRGDREDEETEILQKHPKLIHPKRLIIFYI